MGSYLDLDDVAAGHPKAEHELHLMREHIKGLESALEELETLRAENERLQNNLEAAESDNEKLIAHIELIESDNAKLIADRDMLKLCADQNEDEVKKMMAERDEMHKKLEAQDDHCKALSSHIDDLNAEREAMMKQKPLARGYKNSMTGTCSDLYWLGDAPEGVTYLYASPLPAQQIPEGYALVPIEPTDEMDREYTLKSGQY